MKMKNTRVLNPRVKRAPASKEVSTRKRQTPENFFLLIRRTTSFGFTSSGRRPSGFNAERMVSIFGCRPKWMYERKLVRRMNAPTLVANVQSKKSEVHPRPVIHIRRRPVTRMTAR